ncbi:MAG: sigma 54-interacting transcriptional regulator [Pseudomonadota bacterium]
MPRFDPNDDKTLPEYGVGPRRQPQVPTEKAYLMAVSGPHAGSVLTLKEGTIVGGRTREAEIFLNDNQVSRRHVQFITRGGETKVADLGSTNGTFVNGDRLTGEHDLVDGDEVQVGATTFRFSTHNPLDGSRLGIKTHAYFETRVAEELDRADRYKRPLSIVMVGLSVSEEEAEEKHEEILKAKYPKIVEYIKSMIRTMDILAHYGKFELEILLPETGRAEALRLAKRIATDKIIDRRIFVSLGIASFPDDGQSSEVLIEKSRQALKLARKSPDERIVQLKDEVRRLTVLNKEVIVKSEKMAQIFELAERIAKSTISVLIQGETGVGKEVVAETIHSKSDRGKKPLVCVNCAALTETLLESELFGHEKGSFTGADHLKIGLFESAIGGTIFLDEIGEMPQKTQAKLLRVLQAKTIMRVGSNREIPTDVRVVTATNKKLEELVAKGIFREDLFYRLNAATIVVPPLRERRDEIPYMVESFTQQFCRENRIPTRKVAPDAMDLLVRYYWPGNIRELKNTIERAVVISDGDTITKEALTSKLTTESDISEPFSSAPGGTVASGATTVGDIKEVVAAYERDIIINALKRSDWNQTKAADLLKLPRRTLVSKIKKYGIKRT